MTKDQLPWLPIAKAVLAGDYDRASRGVKQAIAMGVRTIRDKNCQAAYQRLKESLTKSQRGEE